MILEKSKILHFGLMVGENPKYLVKTHFNTGLSRRSFQYNI